MANSDLKKAKKEKNDEFYTQLQDIVDEIAQHSDYVKQFEGKTVLMNCDDPEWSSFVEFFRKFFKKLKLKKIIATHYNSDGSPSYKLEWYGEKIHGDTVNMIKTPLKGNGDFRSEECIELLKEADILCSNPPFSLFRAYIELVMKYNKKFLVIGNMNAITYKEVFPLIKENKLWAGYGFNMSMIYKTPYPNTLESNRKYVISHGYNPDEGYVKVPAICWFTNLDIDKRHEPLILTKNYKGNEDRYPKYDNYDAINCDKVADIPKDYFGIVGVPISYLDKYVPSQFSIIGIGNSRDNFSPNKTYINAIKHKKDGTEVNGNAINCVLAIQTEEKPINQVYYTSENSKYLLSPYARILIQRVPEKKEE